MVVVYEGRTSNSPFASSVGSLIPGPPPGLFPPAFGVAIDLAMNCEREDSQLDVKVDISVVNSRIRDSLLHVKTRSGGAMFDHLTYNDCPMCWFIRIHASVPSCTVSLELYRTLSCTHSS